MGWRFGSVRIYTTSIDEDTKNIIARLQALNNKTILHRFGYESDIYRLTGTVATTPDKDTLKSYSRTGTAYTLSGPDGSLGTYYVNTVKSSRLPVECFVLFDRPALSGNEPLYTVSMELYIND